jgi:drug/metabolite transporter (DMT)-like permease
MRHSFGAGLLAGFIAVVCWGLQLPIARDVYHLIDPFHITAIRYIAATSILLPILLLREGVGALRYQGRGGEIWVIGALGMSFSPMLVFYGISFTGAERGAVVVALQPLMMALAQWILHRRRPARFTFACIAAAFCGVVLVVTKGGVAAEDTPHAILGSAMILSGGICWVLYTIGTERLSGWSAWRITVSTMIPGTAVTVMLTLLFIGLGLSTTPTMATIWQAKWELAFLSFIGVSFGMMAWNFSSRRIGALNSTLLINFMPVVTFIYRAFQGHRFALVEIVGAGIVVTALIANNVFLRRQYLQHRHAA